MKYLTPEVKVTEFESEDVIATSTADVGAGEGFDSGDGPDLG